jgi:pimeloyl-ACP methyl ester carboxylesterase
MKESTSPSQDTTKTANGHYASVNGLNMYYETHGSGGIPLVLIHGAFSAIGTSFGKLLPTLAKTRQVIAVEMQAHGHTADINRPLNVAYMADDTAALLRHLKIETADIFGYSMGAGVALQLAIQHPDLVRKLVVASISFKNEGFHPELIGVMDSLKPEYMMGTPWQEEYARIAPNPGDFATLVEKVKNNKYPDVPAETIRSIKAPTLIIIGDSDIVRPEHAVEMFRLLGGGVSGDNVGMPNSQLAVLPGTSHTTVVERADVLLSIIPAFLDAPMPDAKSVQTV